jgi:hypothetical protein
MMAEDASSASPADEAYFALMASDIERFLDRPADPWSLPGIPTAPPGAPIGQPAMDWLGGGQSLLTGQVQALDAFTTRWFQEMEPYCSVDGESGW